LVERVRGLVLPVFGVVAGLLMLSIAYAPSRSYPYLYRERNFYGTVKVRRDLAARLNLLEHGTTLHGVQSLDKPAEPLAYFYRAGPVGQYFEALRAVRGRRDVMIVGLGVGTLVCYAQPGERWTYLEIDPAVVRVAEDPHFFTYLRDGRHRGVDVRVVLGDGRLKLAEEQGKFGLIVLDAFSSDYIPAHLLTREALQLYQQRLTDDGVLAFQITSRYVNLAPVLAGLARDAGLLGVLWHGTPQEEQRPFKARSDWVLLARRPEHLGKLVEDQRWLPVSLDGVAAVWTDDYYNVIGTLRWGEKAEAGARTVPR
jgi:hypothetical protein